MHDLALLDPDPYWECGSVWYPGARKLIKLTNKPDFQPVKKSNILPTSIFLIGKFNFFVTKEMSDQEPDPH